MDGPSRVNAKYSPKRDSQHKKCSTSPLSSARDSEPRWITGLNIKHQCQIGFELASTDASADSYRTKSKFLSSLSRASFARVGRWIPAFAGMTGFFEL